MKKRKIFLKILSMIMLVAVIISVAFSFLIAEDSRHICALAKENASVEFKNGAENLQRVFSQARYAMSEILGEKVGDSYLGERELREDMNAVLVERRSNEFSKYAVAYFVMDMNAGGKVYELNETYDATVFFGRKFTSDTYTEGFWRNEAVNGEAFKVLQSDMFSVATAAKMTETELIPVAYSPLGSSRYIIVMLLDADHLAEDFGFSAIKSGAGECLYAVDGFDGTTDVTGETDGGYTFSFKDSQNGNLTVLGFVANSRLHMYGNGRNMSVVLLCGGLILGALVLGVMIAISVAKDKKAVSDAFCENEEVKKKYPDGVFDADEIGDAVDVLVKSAVSEAKDENHESVLDSFVLQSRMRDVYVGIDDVEERINLSKNFFMIYFEVNYRREFEDYVGKNTGKATFSLKQLVEGYFESWGLESTTFQIENTGIISVFSGNIDSERRHITEKIVEKLLNESEYAFFTVATSKEYNGGHDDIKVVYDRLLRLTKHRKPALETQMLFEDDMKNGGSHFYFSVEEMGKLSAMLQNGTLDEVERKVLDIVDYNIKKEINNFELYLLGTEIINCAVKLINRVLHSIPAHLEISETYRKLEHVKSPEEFRHICIDFLSETMELVRQNKREDDYIISYILDYVDNHYAEDIYLNLFAEKLKLTGAYISSYFKEKMNVNLSDYVNNYRIKKAVALSENPQNKNKDIAAMVGLPNINTFIRLFKKYTGYTPAEYRKKHFGE